MSNYTNDMEQIRQGLSMYIGHAQAATPPAFTGRAKNQVVVGLLMDEAIKCSQTELDNAYCDPYILVPLFKAMDGVLHQQQDLLAQNPTEENKARMIDYMQAREVCQQIIKEQMPKTAEG